MDKDLEGARSRRTRLAELGVSLDSIAKKLLKDGVEAFAKPFESLIRSIEVKKDKLQRGKA